MAIPPGTDHDIFVSQIVVYVANNELTGDRPVLFCCVVEKNLLFRHK